MSLIIETMSKDPAGTTRFLSNKYSKKIERAQKAFIHIHD